MSWHNMSETERNIAILLLIIILIAAVALARLLYTQYLGVPFEYQPLQLMPTYTPAPTATLMPTLTPFFK
jgi:hypothetical protein